MLSELALPFSFGELMQIKTWCGVLFFTLMGCSPAPVRVSAAFDEGKARAMLKPGTNEVTGRIMLAMSSGTLVTCANSTVSLVPATDYAKEWARKFYELDTGKFGNIDAAFRMDSRESPITFQGAEAFYAATRTAQCDEDGDFSFLKVADGEFFVVARTRWLGKDHDYFDYMYGTNDAQEEDGSFMQRIRVKAGQVIDLKWVPPRPTMLGGQGLPGSR